MRQLNDSYDQKEQFVDKPYFLTLTLVLTLKDDNRICKSI
jgi:hypothetical protein